ncbi:MAG: PD-(D/E)XK nuclease family protein [Candidatus Zixiibacteriota bacterium]|nr:MAG: PD-(D/E)XK nuclease family protein [candidate division Zixibacteria bacterium]
MARSYSNSKIGTFRTCPRQYKFQYVEKAAVEKPVSVEAFLGDAVHRTLERLYRLKLNGRVQTADEMLKSYHEYWEGPDKDKRKVTRENLAVEDYINTGSDALKRHYEKYHPFDDGVTMALEKNIRFPLDPAGHFTLVGVVDRISRRDDGVVEIIDYKTSSVMPTQRSLADNNQMGLYQMGVKYLWPDFERIELKQIFLRQGMELKAVMDEEKLEEIRYRTYQAVLEIERAVGDDNFPPKESAICDWCIYYELCPAKRHRLALDEEIEVAFDADQGKDLAEQYLQLSESRKKIDSELKALKEDLVRYCAEFDVTNVAATEGSVTVSATESESFPTKSDNEKEYLAISLLAREGGLEECFKLDPRVLYKEFFARKRLPEDLEARLKKYLIKKRQSIVRTYFKGQNKRPDE